MQRSKGQPHTASDVLCRIKTLQLVCVHYASCRDKTTQQFIFYNKLVHSTMRFEEVHMNVLQEDSIMQCQHDSQQCVRYLKHPIFKYINTLQATFFVQQCLTLLSGTVVYAGGMDVDGINGSIVFTQNNSCFATKNSE